jgi:hypothetical protein
MSPANVIEHTIPSTTPNVMPVPARINGNPRLHNEVHPAQYDKAKPATESHK